MKRYLLLILLITAMSFMIISCTKPIETSLENTQNTKTEDEAQKNSLLELVVSAFTDDSQHSRMIDDKEGLKDESTLGGNELKDKITFTIHAYPPTTAAYSLIAEDGKKVSKVSIDPNAYDLEFSWLHLASTPKTFHITFSNDINQDSVINSIKQGLKGKANFTYQWLDARTLEVKLDSFEIRRDMPNQFAISLDQGKDIYGNKILDSLNFFIGLPNTLGYIDLVTQKNVELYAFNNFKVIAENMGYIDDYLILYDSKTKKGRLFNINTREIDRDMTLLGTMFDHGYINWAKKNTALSFDAVNKKIIEVNLEENVVTDVVNISNIGINYEAYVKIKEIKISPNGDKLAFIVGEYPDPPKLFIYTMADKTWKNYEFQTHYIGWPMPFIWAELKWVDNQHLQYITGEPLLERFNINTGEKETVIEGKILAHSEDRSIYIISRPVAWQYGTAYRYYIIKDAEEILINDNELVESQDRRSLFNFQFLNEHEVVYNDSEREDKIFLYNIQEDTEKVIGTGKIVGLADDARIFSIKDYDSEDNLLSVYDREGNKVTINFKGQIIGSSSDRKRVYYLTNYENLYEIP